jgi:hypothetical protein
LEQGQSRGQHRSVSAEFSGRKVAHLFPTRHEFQLKVNSAQTIFGVPWLRKLGQSVGNLRTGRQFGRRGTREKRFGKK